MGIFEQAEMRCSWAHVGLGRSSLLARYVSNQGAFEFHYFFMRKFWMAYKCMGLVVMPGGPCLASSCLTLMCWVSSKLWGSQSHSLTHIAPLSTLFGIQHQALVRWMSSFRCWSFCRPSCLARGSWSGAKFGPKKMVAGFHGG